MTYSTFQGKLPVVNFLEFENKIEIDICSFYLIINLYHIMVCKNTSFLGSTLKCLQRMPLFYYILFFIILNNLYCAILLYL